MLQKNRTLAVLALLLLVSLVGPNQTTQAAIVSGFSISAQLISATIPVAIDFSPDEKLLFIAEQNGTIQVADVSQDTNATLTKRAAKALDIQQRICSNSERGLLGIAVDPDYATNGYVYVYYTFNRNIPDNDPDQCRQITDGPATSETPYNRVSRFTVGQGEIISPSSEKILIDNILSTGGNHNGGGLRFGKDGYLYVAVGDGGCDYAGNSGCGGQNNAARDLHVLLGKILRIDPAGATAADRIPVSNPFRGSGQICADTPTTTAGIHCQETFAYGFRNPFRFTTDPNTAGSTTTLYVNDVGQSAWEEIDLLTANESGKDFRWNMCEGSHVNSGVCGPPTANERNPLHEYAHDGDTAGCSSITSGAVVPTGVWPSGYSGKYLFADYVCSKIFMIDPAAPATRTVFADNISEIVDMEFGPGPNGLRSLYYVDRDSESDPLGVGQIQRITPSTGNRPPRVDTLSASPQYGSKDVTFTGTASDLDGDALSYEWNFGNGITRITSSASTNYIYPADGQYTATLQVRDSNNAVSTPPFPITIDTTNQPPEPVIAAPAAGATFGVGDIITLSGSAFDPDDGPLSDSALSWTVLLHHRADLPGDHTHPFFGPQVGNNLTITTQSPEDLDAATNSYLEILLTATDSEGAVVTVSRDLMPAKVGLTLRTIPAGLVVLANGTPFRDGDVVTSWRNYVLNLSVAPYPQRTSDGRWLVFTSWENTSTSLTRPVTTPATPQTYTATFDKDASLQFMPTIVQP